MTGEQRIRDLIERSSLGTPDAKTMIARTSPEQARRVMERARQLGNGGPWASCRHEWRAHERNEDCQDPREVEL